MAKVITFKRGLWEQIYLPEIVRGMSITLRHFLNNTLLRPWKSEIVTIRYPEEKREYPPRFRGEHRLMKRKDGSVRCVACMMCSTICPANCIHIVAGDLNDSNEKYPVSFDIDELVCVACGMCVEACPCDAIRMDTGIHVPPVEHRADTWRDKEQLMERGSRSIAIQGGASPDKRPLYDKLGDARAIFDAKKKYNSDLKID